MVLSIRAHEILAEAGRCGSLREAEGALETGLAELARDGSDGDIAEIRTLVTARIDPILRFLYRHFRELDALRLPAVRTAELDRYGGLLSRREAEIADRLLIGLSPRRIAAELGIRPGTVERHIANVYDKLEVSCREELREVLGGPPP